MQSFHTLRESSHDRSREQWVIDQYLKAKGIYDDHVTKKIPVHLRKYRGCLDFQLYKRSRPMEAVSLIEVKTAQHKHHYGCIMNEAKYSTAVRQSIDLCLPAILLCLADEAIYSWVIKQPNEVAIKISSQLPLVWLESKGRGGVKNIDDDEPIIYMPWNLAERHNINVLAA